MDNGDLFSFDAILATERIMPDKLLPDGRWTYFRVWMPGFEIPESRQVMLVFAHARERIEDLSLWLGSTRDLRVEGGKLLGRICFHSGYDIAMKVYGFVLGKHIKCTSVRYDPVDEIELRPGNIWTSPDGQIMKNERDTVLRVFRRWSIAEATITWRGRNPECCVLYEGA